MLETVVVDPEEIVEFLRQSNRVHVRVYGRGTNAWVQLDREDAVAVLSDEPLGRMLVMRSDTDLYILGEPR